MSRSPLFGLALPVPGTAHLAQLAPHQMWPLVAFLNSLFLSQQCQQVSQQRPGNPLDTVSFMSAPSGLSSQPAGEWSELSLCT